MIDFIGKDVIITDLCFKGNEPSKSETLYIGRAYKQILKIVHEISDGLFLTDFFIPEFIDNKNDFCHYGFLVISKDNFKLLI